MGPIPAGPVLSPPGIIALLSYQFLLSCHCCITFRAAPSCAAVSVSRTTIHLARPNRVSTWLVIFVPSAVMTILILSVSRLRPRRLHLQPLTHVSIHHNRPCSSICCGVILLDADESHSWHPAKSRAKQTRASPIGPPNRLSEHCQLNPLHRPKRQSPFS